MNGTITTKIMEQYETIRRIGKCNMYDLNCVRYYADRLDLYDLASIEKDDYVYILQNFPELMAKFNIQQSI